MSSTNRKNAQDRHVSDYYVTPRKDIAEFLSMFLKDEQLSLLDKRVLDPCAGGDEKHPMSYPDVLQQYGVDEIVTNDIREDSLADHKVDFRYWPDGEMYDMVITNPPFNQAQEIIEKAISLTVEGGYVVMLLRLNFLGSKQRKPFWEEYPPYRIYVHHKRMSFKDTGGTDSIEYAHFVWRIGERPQEAKLKIL